MRAVCLVLLLVLLSACGKKGLPVPPGPQSAIIYPKAYPSH